MDVPSEGGRGDLAPLLKVVWQDVKSERESKGGSCVRIHRQFPSLELQRAACWSDVPV